MTRYVFKDTETTGADTRFDQILQFAAILTDDALNELEVVNIRCRRLPHILPSPIALKVTNIDPWDIAKADMSYFEMAAYIHGKYREWSPATFIGHNTLGFDEEIERTMFYMNLLDPYVTNTKGSSRADTLVMLRAACALRPELLKIRLNEETGSPIFKLEILAPDNGFDGHAAHDALGDLRANIYVAKLVKDRAPDLWAALMRNTNPVAVDEIIGNPIVLMMTHFGKPEFFPATRIVMNPENKRQALMLDLTKDFHPWLDKTPEEIAAGIFTKESPFQTLKTNAQPTVFNTTDPIAAAKYQEVVPADIQERLIAVQMHPLFRENCLQALRIQASNFRKSEHIEEQIYQGFPSSADKDRMKAIHAHADWAERQSTASGFQDKRMRKIFDRLLWSEAPHLLPANFVDAIDASVVANRVLGSPNIAEKPRWTTLATAREDLAAISGHPLAPQIARWYDELEKAVTQNPAAIRSFARHVSALDMKPKKDVGMSLD